MQGGGQSSAQQLTSLLLRLCRSATSLRRRSADCSSSWSDTQLPQWVAPDRRMRTSPQSATTSLHSTTRNRNSSSQKSSR